MKPRTYEYDGRSVTILSRLIPTQYDGERCYLVHGEGEIGLYLAPGSRVLNVMECEDGTWRLWYVPDDDDFPAYAMQLDVLGEWSMNGGCQ